MPRCHFFQQEIARHFEDNVGDLDLSAVQHSGQVPILKLHMLRRWSDLDISTYEIDGLNPIVLVGRHVEFFENVPRLSFLEHLYTGRVCVVDVLEHVQQADEEQESAVDLSHDLFILRS